MSNAMFCIGLRSYRSYSGKSRSSEATKKVTFCKTENQHFCQLNMSLNFWLDDWLVFMQLKILVTLIDHNQVWIMYNAAQGKEEGFFMMVLSVEYIFLTTFYASYFNRQLHITLKISSSSYIHVIYENGPAWLHRVLVQYDSRHSTQSLFKFIYTYFHDKRPLPGFKPGTTKVNQSPRRCATNWVIQAWIKEKDYNFEDRLEKHFNNLFENIRMKEK